MGSSGKGKSTDAPILFPLSPIPGTDAGVDDWGGDPSLVTHRGIRCKGPQCSEKTEVIRGIRYKCSACANIDFDDACMRDLANPHDRTHVFWPCYGECVFEERVTMRPANIPGLQEFAGNAPVQYLTAPQQVGQHSASAFLNVEELGKRLFGINQGSDDQLLVHWKNGIPAVRLINLLPGKPNDGLECYFTSTRLDHPEPYEALCCDWHTGMPDEVIESASFIWIVDEYRPVRHVTAHALKAVRSPSEIRTLWVEELCVQAENADAMAFQVRSTSLIFNRAEQTILWAGYDNEHTTAVWTLIEMLSHRCGRKDPIYPSPSDLQNDAALDELELLPIGSDKWQSLLRFIPPQLFAQGWLLHDIAFAKQAVVKCGEYECEWWQIARLRDLLSQPSWMALGWRQPTFDDSGYVGDELDLL